MAALIVTALVCLGIALAIFGRETKFRINQRRWADASVGALMILIVTLLLFAALRILLDVSGALDALEDIAASDAA